MTPKNANDFFDLVVNRKMYSGKENLKFYLTNLFENVDLAQKEVLDVGGGKGLLSLYAAINGAKKAVCLEPEKEGSATGMTNGYNELRRQLPETLPVEMLPLTLQEYAQQACPGKYDAVIMHNSINHLNEEACIHLLTRENSYREYVTIFKSVYRIMKKDGVLIATDCSCKNFFNDIGIKNVFTPSIEWHKHHQPHTWISVLKDAGFKNPIVKWLSPNRFRKPGQLIMGNSFIAYFTKSYFKVMMQK